MKHTDNNTSRKRDPWMLKVEITSIRDCEPQCMVTYYKPRYKDQVGTFCMTDSAFNLHGDSRRRVLDLLQQTREYLEQEWKETE